MAAIHTDLIDEGMNGRMSKERMSAESMLKGHSAWLALIVLLGSISAGCRNHVSDDLQGSWIGKPDTAAKRALREQRRYRLVDDSNLAGKMLSDSRSEPASSEPHLLDALQEERPGAESSTKNDRVEVTDWEKLEVCLIFHFQRDGRIDMSLADGSQSRTGKWQVVQQTPATVVIEIETRPPSDLPANPGPNPTVRRRFELLPDYEANRCVGFLLHEQAADPRLGSLYFTRQE